MLNLTLPFNEEIKAKKDKGEKMGAQGKQFKYIRQNFSTPFPLRSWVCHPKDSWSTVTRGALESLRIFFYFFLLFFLKKNIRQIDLVQWCLSMPLDRHTPKIPFQLTRESSSKWYKFAFRRPKAVDGKTRMFRVKVEEVFSVIEPNFTIVLWAPAISNLTYNNSK